MKIFTTGQVAKICKVSPRQISSWCDRGKLKSYRIPGSQDRRITRDYLLEFLNSNGFSTDDVPTDDATQAPAQPIADAWCATLTVKCNELELIASWASQVREDACRDHCRMAIAALRKSIAFRQDVLRATSEHPTKEPTR